MHRGPRHKAGVTVVVGRKLSRTNKSDNRRSQSAGAELHRVEPAQAALRKRMNVAATSGNTVSALEFMSMSAVTEIRSGCGRCVSSE